MKKIAPQRTVRLYYLRFLRLKGDPRFLARGVAAGVFIGITPTIPFHTILALTFALCLRGSKIAALLASVAVSNPLTFFFQYYLAWKIGNWITASDLSWDKVASVFEFITSDAGFKESIKSLALLGHETLTILILGGCILALPFTAASYMLSLNFFSTLHTKRKEKQSV